MAKNYYLGIDQSTQGTKAVLFDRSGAIVMRRDRPHRQIISEDGWVSHDLDEIYANTIGAVRDVVGAAGIDPGEVAGVGISNQRETSAAFDRKTGKPLADAIVWQCARAEGLCRSIEEKNPGAGALVKERSGLKLSPYFPAPKYAWLLTNVPAVRSCAEETMRGPDGKEVSSLVFGTIDTWLVYKLTGDREVRTDYSNASRTGLLNLISLSWDEDLLRLFGIRREWLPELTDSDACFGWTDFEGFLPEKVPIHGVLGDSHAALFGQGCFNPGDTKSTYGTGSSVMMNIGERPAFTEDVVTSLAWRRGGIVQYVLEGNINYSGAVITWLKDDVHLIESASETQKLAEEANPEDTTYLVPAFSGLGAPYWKSDCRAVLCGMSRVTGKNEIVRAALDSIAYQISDILDVCNQAAEEASGIRITSLRVDGGPTKNAYLMQKQSDTAQIPVAVPASDELSAIGAAWNAGIAQGFYEEKDLFAGRSVTWYKPKISAEENRVKRDGWNRAVAMTTGRTDY